MAAGTLGTAAPWPMVAQEPARLAEIATEWMAAEHVPGMAVALVDSATVRWTGAWGLADGDRGTSVADTTVFTKAAGPEAGRSSGSSRRPGGGSWS